MATENRIPEIIRSSMENIRSMFDANKIVGDPINTPQGTTIIPISKITMGIAATGFDYNAKNPQGRQNFGGGSGTGISVHPVGFLVVSANGDVELINIGVNQASDPVDQVAGIIERSPEIFAKIKAIFAKPTVDDGGDTELKDE